MTSGLSTAMKFAASTTMKAAKTSASSSGKLPVAEGMAASASSLYDPDTIGAPMNTKRTVSALLAAAVMMTAAVSFAGEDHSKLVTGTFKTGPDATKACLECHEK